MTDPLSLSGTAVGIISFGLTVCQHLVEYCSSVKGCDKEASSIANKANGLQSTINVVRELAAKGDLENNPVFADVLNKVITCEGIRELEAQLKICMGGLQPISYSKTDSLQEKIRTHGRKALYPFRRGGLLCLRDTLDGIQANLDTSVQVCV